MSVIETIRYFAYDSNMDVDQIVERVGPVEKVGNAKLPDWRLAFNRKGKDHSGKANIVESPGDVVWGVVYELTRDQMGILEVLFERGYRARELTAFDQSGNPLTVHAFIAKNPDRERPPTPPYKQIIVRGAKKQELPVDYVRFLESISVKGTGETPEA
jgi:gamma-glutamylcyclotransferase